MLVTQVFQTRFARACAIDQMLDDKLSDSFDSQLRQGYYCAQQFANICHRQRRQLVKLQFFVSFRCACTTIGTGSPKAHDAARSD